MSYEDFLRDNSSPEAEAAADARARADVAAGRVVTNAAVMNWLKSLSVGKRLPRPQVGE